jgi:hypothetical protein
MYDAIEKLSLVEKAKVLLKITRRCFRTVNQILQNRKFKTDGMISPGYQLLKETLITLTDSLKCIMILWDIEVL